MREDVHRSASLSEAACAKINLTLRVTGRRADGFHLLESLVAFADIADTLTLDPGEQDTIDIAGPFAEACGAPAGNLAMKALAALRAIVPGLRGGRFRLEKNIPVAAGLGGGSADAGAALRLLAAANSIPPGDPRLMQAARNVGADVPVCLRSRACVMRGIGEQLSPPLALPRLPALLVNPGVALATKDVFARLDSTARTGPSLDDIPLERDALIAMLAAQSNDLTQAAIAQAPVVTDVLAALSKLPGNLLARMSGSGPTCIGLFATQAAAADAARRLGAAQPRWWVRAATLG